jgi:hypothetical protein
VEDMKRSLILSVSVGVGCYRHIRINENATLFELYQTILDAFDFENGDHMHAFFMDNRPWKIDAQYICPGADLDSARGFSDKVKLSKFHLGKGDKFLLIYDFGDDWRFQIKVLRVLDEPTQIPDILKSVGQVSQYGDDEDDEDEDEDEDDEDDDF